MEQNTLYLELDQKIWHDLCPDPSHFSALHYVGIIFKKIMKIINQKQFLLLKKMAREGSSELRQ